MSMRDKVSPHRLFINRALRTASGELRDHIDSYRIEHELAVQRCQNEIEAAKAEKDRQFELLKQAYLNELAQDSYALGELQDLVLAYADAYTKRELLSLNKKKMTLELQLFNGYGDFLTAQMKLIGDEIAILERRQEALVLQVKIDDVVALIGMTGADLSCNDSDNPKTLLEKVNSALFESSDLLPQTKAALFKLRKLLQERAEYLPLIQYISWLIQQKKNLSQDLSRERFEVNEAKKALNNQLFVIKTELKQLAESMLKKAIRIRNVWAEPLADIFVELAAVTESLDQNYSRQKYIRAEIRTMKSERSNDNNRWEQLQAEGKAVYEAIGQLNGEKAKLYEQRQRWFHRKNTILNLLKKNKIFLLSPKGDHATDEIRVLQLRRADIYKEIEEIDHRLEERSAQISNEHNQQKTMIADQIRAAERAVSEKKRRLAEADERVKKLKGQDNRSFVARIFSESKDVAKAKTCRGAVHDELLQAAQQLAALPDKLKTIDTAYEKQMLQVNETYKRRISECRDNISNIDLAIAFIQEKKRR